MEAYLERVLEGIKEERGHAPHVWERLRNLWIFDIRHAVHQNLLTEEESKVAMRAVEEPLPQMQ